MRVTSISPAKVILFGEHYVVYGAKGIAAAITPYNEMEVELERAGSPSLDYISTKKRDCLKKDAKNCEEKSAHPIEALYLHLLKELPALGKCRVRAKVKKCWKLKGVGNSASLCAAFSYCVRELLKSEKGDKILFDDVQVGEEAAHGKGRASGIDASAAVHGGIFSYEKSFAGKPPKIISCRLNMKKGHCFFLIDTSVKGKKAGTAMQIERFAKAHKIYKKPAELWERERQGICKEYETIAKDALSAIKRGDMEKLAECMQKNHGILRKGGVSSPSIEKAVKICMKNGAIGAKMTGAGGEGGAVIALVGKKDVEKIRNSLSKEKFSVYEFEFAKEGVHKK